MQLKTPFKCTKYDLHTITNSRTCEGGVNGITNYQLTNTGKMFGVSKRRATRLTMNACVKGHGCFNCTNILMSQGLELAVNLNYVL